MMDLEDHVKARRAIEALRAGVPNRDAVIALGCAQPEIERQFRLQLLLSQDPDGAPAARRGMLIEGGFGSGKSHLLEFLQCIALGERFVCSKVVISKETPLHDPVKLFRSAIESAVLPDGRRGDAITEIATGLDPRAGGTCTPQEFVGRVSDGLNARFGATLFLYTHLERSEDGLGDSIVRFWSGDKLGLGEVRKGLRSCRETATYSFDKIDARSLALERFEFVSRLIAAAGFAGWVLLVDEAELVSRYSWKQRARSYVELARLLGKLEREGRPGPMSVLAITDDFQNEALEVDGKGDLEKIPLKLGAEDPEMAGQAELGMSAIQNEGIMMSAPDPNVIHQIFEKVRGIYETAYGWTPPLTSSFGLRETSTRMREYIKGWITQWDLGRLYPAYSPDIEATLLKLDYTEDAVFDATFAEALDPWPDPEGAPNERQE